MNPSIIIEADRIDSDVFFRIQASDVNGLLDLRIWEKDSRQVLWHLNLNYFMGAEIKYGDVPIGFTTLGGILADATQFVPMAGRRPGPLPVGKPLIMSLAIQYDTITGAATRTLYYSFSTDGEGRLSPLVRIPMPLSDDIPD